MAQEDCCGDVLREVVLFLCLEGFQALQDNILSLGLTTGLSLLWAGIEMETLWDPFQHKVSCIAKVWQTGCSPCSLGRENRWAVTSGEWGSNPLVWTRPTPVNVAHRIIGSVLTRTSFQKPWGGPGFITKTGCMLVYKSQKEKHRYQEYFIYSACVKINGSMSSNWKVGVNQDFFVETSLYSKETKTLDRGMYTSKQG